MLRSHLETSVSQIVDHLVGLRSLDTNDVAAIPGTVRRVLVQPCHAGRRQRLEAAGDIKFGDQDVEHVCH